MTRLILTSPDFAGQSCPLPDGTHRLGRAPQNAIVIQDESVSSEHCELLVSGPEVIVRELGSRNGTYVAGIRVEAQHGVERGQVVRFGRVEAKIEFPEMSDETTTDNTAVFSYRRALQPLEEGGTESSSGGLPVVFRPVRADDSGPSTMTMPRPASERGSAAVPAPQAAARAPGGGGVKGWIWIVLMTVVVAVSAWWWLR